MDKEGVFTQSYYRKVFDRVATWIYVNHFWQKNTVALAYSTCTNFKCLQGLRIKIKLKQSCHFVKLKNILNKKFAKKIN